MQVLPLGRPFTAQVWLGWAAIGPAAAMQAAANPIVVEVPTSRDDLGLDGEVAGAFHFAEIRRAARSHQGLQLPLALRAHDLDLKVPAAGGPTQIVGGTA
jgi:hypothetical protein